jgi:hypothetical protein
VFRRIFRNFVFWWGDTKELSWFLDNIVQRKRQPEDESQLISSFWIFFSSLGLIFC